MGSSLMGFLGFEPLGFVGMPTKEMLILRGSEMPFCTFFRELFHKSKHRKTLIVTQVDYCFDVYGNAILIQFVSRIFLTDLLADLPPSPHQGQITS